MFRRRRSLGAADEPPPHLRVHRQEVDDVGSMTFRIDEGMGGGGMFDPT